MIRLEAASRTHLGLVRQRNEDALYAGHSLFAVADGMGGHVAGDIASTTVIETLRHCDHQQVVENPSARLGAAVREANEALRQRIEREPGLRGMGTTLVALLWDGAKTSAIVNVGDSRIYRLRSLGTDRAAFAQLSEDHTYGHLVADGAVVPHLSERLARFLDGQPTGRSPDLTVRSLSVGDRLLLCSDGLSAVLPQERIRSVLESLSGPQEVTDQLVDLVIDHGGPDNISVVVVDVRDTEC